MTSLSENIGKMLIYGVLEALSLIVLHSLSKRYLGVDVLHLLAFVLETHFFNLQAKLFMFLNLALHFNLVHFGKIFFFLFVLSSII